mgnify:FL=1
MSIKDRSIIEERRKPLCTMQNRYVQADRNRRGRLLDEIEAVAELHRKSHRPDPQQSGAPAPARPQIEYDKLVRRWYNAPQFDARSLPTGWTLRAY